MIRETLDELPLIGILLLTVVLVLVAIEVGFRIGLWRSRSREFDSEALLSAMTGANLALLAFIMEFSFSQAAEHYSNRKRLILEEANAIGTMYLRAGLVNPEQGEKIRHLLRDYTEIRLTVARQEELDPARMIAESLDLQEQIWDEIERLARDREPNELDALLVESTNALFDIHERRVSAALRNRIAPSIWAALGVLLTLSMLGIGHFSGVKGRRNPVSSTALALSFSMVVYLIADLDRPTGGLARADPSAMLALSERL